MRYPHVQLAAGEILHYVHTDGFTERLLNATLVVDAAHDYHVGLRHHLPHPAAGAHVREYRGSLPARVASAVTNLLIQPDLAALPACFPGFDDFGSRFFLFVANGQEYRVEVEEPYGRHGPAPASPAERALLATRLALDDWLAALYADALAAARRP